LSGAATTSETARPVAPGPGAAVALETARAVTPGPGAATALETARAVTLGPGAATASETARAVGAGPMRAPAAEPARSSTADSPRVAPQDSAPKPLPEPAGSVPTASAGVPPSTRDDPPEYPSKPNGARESIADTFERLLSTEDVEARLDLLEQPSASVPAPGVAPTDLSEVRSLFAELAANHVRPVRDFMMDVRWGDATVDWVAICEPALRSLSRAADTLDLGEVRLALDRFSDALGSIQSDPARTVSGERRQRLLARYENLSRVMPQAFALELDRTQRESVILQSLLLQVPGVKKITIDKMIAAGLSTLEAMFLATPADIVATTGMDGSLAQRIVDRFRAHRDQVQATVPDATRGGERDRIAELTARLRREHDEYERLAQAWSSDASDRKRQIRKARAQTLLDIQVGLARLGEVDRLARIERLPFDAKLDELESFLEEASDKYAVQP